MTREEISNQIIKATDYLGALKVEGYKNAKILVTGIDFLNSLSKEVLLEDANKEVAANDDSDK